MRAKFPFLHNILDTLFASLDNYKSHLWRSNLRRIVNLISKVDIWLKKNSEILEEGLIFYSLILPSHIVIIAWLTGLRSFLNKQVVSEAIILFLEVFILVIIIASFFMMIGILSIWKIIMLFILVVDLLFSVISIRNLQNVGTYIFIFVVLDFILSFWIIKSKRSIKDKFTITERTRTITTTFKGKTIVEEVKTKSYQVVLPIIIAIITASGTVITALLKHK